MKKLFTLSFVFCALLALDANAQEFKKFKAGLGLGYAAASGEGSSGGVLIYVEPAYRLSDELSLGLRVESALITRGFSEDVDDASFDIAAIGSYTLNGQYYFSNNKFRPFAGLGLGLFSLAGVSMDGVDEDLVEPETKFGFYPRIGFDLGHFNMTLDYNLIPASEVEGVDGEFKNSYFGVRIGAFFGGGRN